MKYAIFNHVIDICHRKSEVWESCNWWLLHSNEGLKNWQK